MSKIIHPNSSFLLGPSYLYFGMVWKSFLLGPSLLLLFLLSCTGPAPLPSNPKQTIMPSKEYPRYWSWAGGEPILLLGASNNDNLFQSPDFLEQLKVLKKAGGNYVRCTMSSRDQGDDWPYLWVDSTQRYDLNRFNPEYWKKFHDLLREASARDIVVQVELWDRFDFSRSPWKLNPFNPINHAPGQLPLHLPPGQNGLIGPDSLLLSRYPDHPSRDAQPFFHSIPGMPKYREELDHLRAYQEAFVDTLLSISLQYGNVLYCMNNETTTPGAWGRYWAAFIRKRAANVGRDVYLTDMYDGFHHPASCSFCQQILRNTTSYNFLDVSQINSRHFGEKHWDTLQYITELLRDLPPRPVNCVKVYGGGETAWGSGTNVNGIRRFNRNVIGGLAAVRHHRPPTGNGLNAMALNSIRAIRTIEQQLKFWELSATTTSIRVSTAAGEAYTATNQRGDYLIYFPGPGRIDLTLPPTQSQKSYEVSVIGYLGTQRKETLTPPYDPSFSIFTKEEKGGWMLLKQVE
jgi:hypothetical protein